MIQLYELKALNIKLFSNQHRSKPQQIEEFQFRVDMEIRKMAEKGLEHSYVTIKDLTAISPFEMHNLINDVSRELLPYFKLNNLNQQIRIDAISITPV